MVRRTHQNLKVHAGLSFKVKVLTILYIYICMSSHVNISAPNAKPLFRAEVRERNYTPEGADGTRHGILWRSEVCKVEDLEPRGLGASELRFKVYGD